MNYIDFQNTFQNFTLFSIADIEKAFPHFDRKVLVAWQKRGYIKKIRNKWYCFSSRKFHEKDLFFTANKIYSPSYVSLESALSYYGFIPEGVFRITSVSTLKTMHFDTSIGYFQYRNISRKLFFGYQLVQQEDSRLAGWYKIADPEKAVLDYFYLNPQYRSKTDFLSLRFNWDVFIRSIDIQTLKTYLKYMDSRTLSKRVHIFLKLYYAQYRENKNVLSGATTSL